MEQVRALVQTITETISTFTELAAAIVIGVAVIEAVWRSARTLVVHGGGSDEAKQNLRLRLGRWLAVSLEFLLAADILRTAIAPSWQDIGQLGAIALIRTALNYFLQREIEAQAQSRQTQSRQERFRQDGEAAPTPLER
ncbi:DUF1622 domain-containing protein [Deinococcus sp.]|uniref:DUF1622 domain-containing protein n=1 Tax=Deinococcus sp. TaxID=47478 RepID=UPI002869DD11|nr:DUF1622 domain-containing protein [Deinococcus sp.]